MLARTSKEADALLDGPIGDKIKDKLQGSGLVGLVYWENSFRILSSKFYEVQKCLSVTHHVSSPWILLVSKKWWDQLSKDAQKRLMDAAQSKAKKSLSGLGRRKRNPASVEAAFPN